MFRPATLLCLFALLLALSSPAQKEHLPFYSEVVEYKKQDSIIPPPQNPVLFIGSSSFRLWKEVQQAFPDVPVVNRGLGGSTLPDLLNFMDEVVYPYRPRQILIYCGENDIATDTVSAKETTARFKAVFKAIRDSLPQVPILYVSIKPSPSREKFLPIVRQANKMIRKYLRRQHDARFVDVYKLMLDTAGKPRKELFGEDMLHMKSEGYAIWQKAIDPYLLKN